MKEKQGKGLELPLQQGGLGEFLWEGDTWAKILEGAE